MKLYMGFNTFIECFVQFQLSDIMRSCIHLKPNIYAQLVRHKKRLS